jgi:hypothetical protein
VYIESHIEGLRRLRVMTLKQEKRILTFILKTMFLIKTWVRNRKFSISMKHEKGQK